MNIVLITDPYPPEIRSISVMMQELAEAFAYSGYDVTVVTCWPGYNLSTENSPNDFQEFSNGKNIRVIRVKTLPTHKVNFLIRGFAHLLLPFLFLRKVKQYAPHTIDAVIVYSPPLPLALVGIALQKQYRCRFVLNIQDIFPQNAIDLGILRNKLLIWFFERMEKKAYRAADYVTTHTKGGMDFLMEKKSIPKEKISVVTNWLDVESYKNVQSKEKFRKHFGLENKFVFLFAGIMGPAQHLDFLIHVAKRLERLDQVCFLFLGDGTEKKRLQAMAQNFGLDNVKFGPFISQKEYPFLLKEVEAGLVCLGMESKTFAMPGKILGFMASGLPVIAFLNKENEAHHFIQEAQCGYAGFSDDVEHAADVMRKFVNEKTRLSDYGRNGYDYAVRHFSKQACIEQLMKLVLQGNKT